MPSVNTSQAAFAPQNGAPQRPVSPFDRSPGTAPASPFQQDQVSSQPVARGIEPNINLLRDQQSSVSPFHRPNGEKVNFLERPAAPAPGAPTQPSGPQPIVFTFPKDIPDGPAQANIQQAVMQEVQAVQQPQQAMQLIAQHADKARTSREASNHFTWGARYHAAQAAETSEQMLQQWNQMNPGQRQVFMAKVQEHRDQAISLLNEAKRHGIETYNSALKANLIYNHFFTTAGPMIDTINDQVRGVITAELDDAWSRWNGSFAKEWQGQNVQAHGIMMILDQTSDEVANHLHRMNSVVSQLN